MCASTDLTGRKFGRLTVVGRGGYKPNGASRLAAWVCECECGSKKEFSGRLLVKGDTRSCGCYNLDRIMERNTKHGCAQHGAPTPEYRAWSGMRTRCLNPRHHKWSLYGGRGIKICDRWSSFEAFLSDMGRKPSPKHSIDRIDVNGNYEPQNCRWATPSEQVRNRRARCVREPNSRRVERHE